jgi:membrane protein DedA with SNARE-associated domain
MPLFHQFLSPLIPHAYVVLVILTILLGEEIILLFVNFTGQGFLSLSKVLLLGLGSALIVDIFLFYLARNLFHQKISKWKKVVRVSKEVRTFVHRIHTHNLLLVLTVRRFLIGTRHATTLYLGTKKMSWSKFMIYNTFSLLIWAAVLVPIAWFTGRGFAQLLHAATRLERLVSLAVLFIIIVILIERLISKKLVNEK